jgi:DNA-directed RNA polymerase specialized sigma24 family protein
LQHIPLNTTALVNEAYLRLAGAGFEANDREHFLALVARAMRQILIDHARAQRRLKRGGGADQVTLTESTALADAEIEQLLAIDDTSGTRGSTAPMIFFKRSRFGDIERS